MAMLFSTIPTSVEEAGYDFSKQLLNVEARDNLSLSARVCRKGSFTLAIQLKV